MLVACILLNMTTREQVDKVIWELFEKYPTPLKLSRARIDKLGEIVRSLGLWRRRAQTLKKFSTEFLDKTWASPIELYGCGKYADDSYQIFCLGEWQTVSPSDHALKWYVDWMQEETREKTKSQNEEV